MKALTLEGTDVRENPDRDARICALERYWRAIAPAGLLPGRQHFDPLDIPELLSRIWLMDVQPYPRRYWWRLIGTEAQAGKLLLRPGDPLELHLEGKVLAEARAVLDRVVETRAPDWGKGRPVMPHAPCVLSLERLILPLARDGRTVDMLLGITVYEWQGSRSGLVSGSIS